VLGSQEVRDGGRGILIVHQRAGADKRGARLGEQHLGDRGRGVGPRAVARDVDIAEARAADVDQSLESLFDRTEQVGHFDDLDRDLFPRASRRDEELDADRVTLDDRRPVKAVSGSTELVARDRTIDDVLGDTEESQLHALRNRADAEGHARGGRPRRPHDDRAGRAIGEVGPSHPLVQRAARLGGQRPRKSDLQPRPFRAARQRLCLLGRRLWQLEERGRLAMRRIPQRSMVVLHGRLEGSLCARNR
jgi:hypothetical protein